MQCVKMPTIRQNIVSAENELFLAIETYIGPRFDFTSIID